MVSELGDSERLTFDIVPDRAADFTAGFLGAGTPLAQAIMGRPAGSVVPYRVGDMAEVHILAVALSERRAADDAAEGTAGADAGGRGEGKAGRDGAVGADRERQMGRLRP